MSSSRIDTVDLNCDIGESYGAYTIGRDADIVPLVTSVNVACGFHAGDPTVIHNTVLLAAQHGVAVGAHPSFPDLQGFGRRPMQLDDNNLFALLVYQIGAVQVFTDLHRVPLQHVKPHGALNNLACSDSRVARVIAKAVKAVSRDLILLAPVGSELEAAGQEADLEVAGEVFADRTYEPDGALRSRSFDDAMLQTEEEVTQHVLNIVTDGVIVAVDGTRIPVQPQSICLHGDGPHAVSFAKAVRVALDKSRVQIRSLKGFIGGGGA